MKEVYTTRRTILKTAAAATVISLAGRNNAATPKPTTEKKSTPIELGITSYTFRNFKLTETLDMTQKLGMKYISLKSMHLPLNSTAEQIREVVKQVKDKGLVLYGAGVIYMNNADQVSQAFDYAKTAGMDTIIGVPSHNLLEMVDAKVKEYDIKVAIHNHGPSDNKYPDPKSIYDKVKNLDPRIGICMDIGHTQRCGQDPAEQAEKYADRMHDLHLKDVHLPTVKGSTIEIGRGIIDIPKLIKTLIRIKYKGVASFEFEKDGKAPMIGLAESVGYIKGVIAAV